MSSSPSSSSVPSSLRSWDLAVCVVHPAAVGLAFAIVTMVVVGLVGCLSLLPTVHGVTFQAVLCRVEPSRVVRDIVVVSVNFCWL